VASAVKPRTIDQLFWSGERSDHQHLDLHQDDACGAFDQIAVRADGPIVRIWLWEDDAAMRELISEHIHQVHA
jgi:hypothetical protein